MQARFSGLGVLAAVVLAAAVFTASCANAQSTLSRPSAAVPMDAKTVVGTPGFFRVGKDVGGAWWFLTPDNQPFFFRGVTSVSSDGWGTKRVDGSSYDQLVKEKYAPSGAAFPRETVARLRGWGFNALGGWSGEEMWEQMPYTLVLNFSKDDKSPKIDGAFVPDVFDPAWKTRIGEIAQSLCAPRKNSKPLVGYFTDNELGWAQAQSEDRPLVFDPSQTTLRDKGEPSLLQLCLSLGPARPAYREAWAFVLKRHGRDLARVARDWNTPDLNAQERLAEWTQARKAVLSPGYVSDDEAWGTVFASRYFRLCAEAVRQSDPNHLILGCRFGAPPGRAVLAACKRPFVDVVSANNYRDNFYERMDIYARGTGLPVLNTEFAWVTDRFTRDPPYSKTIPPSVEKMLLRGRASVEKAFSHPQMVGYTWYRWVDKADFVPPVSYGLVSVKDVPNETHLSLLREMNARADALHAAPPKR